VNSVWPLGPSRPRILVIKLGAMGDFVQALGPMQAIRRAHPEHHIALLTTAPFAELAKASGYFDSLQIDLRPHWSDVSRWWRLRQQLRGGRFERVYDLQTSDRTGWYFRLFGPGRRPEWSGIVKGCSHPHDNPRRDRMHTMDRQAEQLRAAGIETVPPPDLSWVAADTQKFGVGSRYVLLVPGGAAHRPAKRWPIGRFAELARDIASRGARPVVVGTASERELGQQIAVRCTDARDLTGKTTMLELFALARGASGAVGNDSGPMHMAAMAGAILVVLFSAESDPALCAPRGPRVTILRRPELSGLAVGEVAAALKLR